MALMRKMTDLQQLSMDLYNGNVAQYSTKEAEQKLREMLVEKIGGEWNYLNFQKNKWDMYAIMQELVTVAISNLTVEAFNDFVEVKDFELGDKVEFKVENTDLYQVAVISNGTNNFRRQKLMDRTIPTTAFKMSLKIYAEMDEFVAGRISWTSMVDKVAKSFQNELATRVGDAMVNAYQSVHSNFKVTGAYDDAQLSELVARVKGATGKEVVIYGTALALSKINGQNIATADKDDRRNFGYVKMFNGVLCVELPQTYNENTSDWGISNDTLLVIPQGEKVIRMGFEGQATIIEDTTGLRQDQQIEYSFARKCHMGILTTSKFGAYEIQ